MIKIYCSANDGQLQEMDHFTKNCWINLINPTEDEINYVIKNSGIIPEFLKHPLDYEERARIEVDEGQTLIIVDIPTNSKDSNKKLAYETMPLGIIVSEEHIITVCSQENIVIKDFEDRKIKSFYAFKKTRFVFQILFRNSMYYLKYLQQINKQTEKIEDELHSTMKNQELYSLLDLHKSLVYFTTSLKSNEVVLEKLLKGNILKMYEEDQDILEDVIIENKQAIEMANTYTSILGGMMDAFASVISNNLNIVMKFLTSVTIVLSIPTIVSGLFGMNVLVPFQHHPHAFLYVIMISFLLSGLTAYIFAKKKLF